MDSLHPPSAWADRLLEQSPQPSCATRVVSHFPRAADRLADAAELKALQAPDIDKIEALAVSVMDAIVVPEMATQAGVAVMKDIREKRLGFARWIRAQKEKLK